MHELHSPHRSANHVRAAHVRVQPQTVPVSQRSRLQRLLVVERPRKKESKSSDHDHAQLGPPSIAIGQGLN